MSGESVIRRRNSKIEKLCKLNLDGVLLLGGWAAMQHSKFMKHLTTRRNFMLIANLER